MESCRKRLRDEGTCSICQNYFTDPVTLNCGHNFCRTCVLKSWEALLTEPTCPLCREQVQVKKLRPNKQLAKMVQIAKDFGNLLKHRVDPAQECKDQICLSLETLRKERGKFLEYKAENERESQDLLEQVKAEKEKTASAFSQLHQFLEEQEKRLQTQMEEVEKEIERQRDEHQATLSAELSNLESLIRELEEKQQQSANEPLQNGGSILERCKNESFKSPVAFPVALKWRIHDFSDINPFLEAIMKQFRASLASGLPLQEANVSLDPATAHRNLILSQDRKSVQWGNERRLLDWNPKRFENWPFVLGHKGFTSGRHFWEVAVGRDEAWSVGVARRSIKRKINYKSPKEGIWDVGMWNGEYRVPRDVSPLFLSQELNRVRVTLNCAGGRVAFFDADTGAQLYACSDASLRGHPILPFFYVVEGGRLTIS